METRRLIVRPDIIDDPDIAPTASYRIANPDGSEEFLSDPIHGYQHQQGIEQEIEVGITQIENPPEGSSSLRYELIRVITKRIL